MGSIFYTIILILLAAASQSYASQEAQLRKFTESRTKPNRHGPVAADAWAEPSVFRNLPTHCRSAPEGAKEADKIAALPGQPPRVNFDQYAGYVTVNEQHGRALFYYFAESPYDASSKPLVLWLNGGPGCSSFGYGAMEELGPFRVNRDGETLRRNKHAWNNVANVIFLESPAGVGFSYSNTSSDYDESGDRRTAVDAYFFLLNWFERFPEYKDRDFYIAGESYGGHYVPQLAATILFLNGFTNRTVINLRGIFVGNPYLDDYKNLRGSYEFLWNHGVISDEVWAKITANCSFGPSDDWPCFVAAHSFEIGSIDRYNIYAPVCLRSPNGTLYSSSYLPGYDPCIDSYIKVYLNNLDVQSALHARMNTPWSGCNDDLAWNDAPISMVPTLTSLVEKGLRVWIYSGDMDDVCPLTATRYSVKDLDLPVTKPWRPWYTPDKEVGGYVQQYKGGFTLASVRGAGHMVPSFQPKRALVLLYSFLKGMLPPDMNPN